MPADTQTLSCLSHISHLEKLQGLVVHPDSQTRIQLRPMHSTQLPETQGAQGLPTIVTALIHLGSQPPTTHSSTQRSHTLPAASSWGRGQRVQPLACVMPQVPLSALNEGLNDQRRQVTLTVAGCRACASTTLIITLSRTREPVPFSLPAASRQGSLPPQHSSWALERDLCPGSPCLVCLPSLQVWPGSHPPTLPHPPSLISLNPRMKWTVKTSLAGLDPCTVLYPVYNQPQPGV